ncbi:uncharacterized protein H6S33_003739 [Morchella sextelata]|uniref:uncharacterized protein n=1 Tax=Morchella sextelata TaxID=1174677 RepID=UPI001D05B965|nr:uncharacterized protein H6S33_003739 [Morchella sextelata]KAH0606078.1 hypothetical protein H6S33_003739 [Morchella sextelata]
MDTTKNLFAGVPPNNTRSAGIKMGWTDCFHILNGQWSVSKNALVYVIDHENIAMQSSDEDSDGNIRLSKFLSRRIKASRLPDAQSQTGQLQVENNYKITFCGTSKIKPLTPYQRMILKNFLAHENNMQESNVALLDIEDIHLDEQVDGFDIPTHCGVFRAAHFETQHRDPYPFKATSLTMKRSNLTRSTSNVLFRVDPRLNVNQYGEVLFFFSVEIPENNDNNFV